jgi:hypothetical protein
MMRQEKYTYELVERFPEEPVGGVLYVSMTYATAMHRCMCGCSEQIVTPFDPTDWKMSYDGETISLSPSIGNWSVPCRSHYWLIEGQVRWSQSWTDTQIAAGRARDRHAKARRFDEPDAAPAAAKQNKPRWWNRVLGRH